jgi:hypothetical protein
VFRNAKCKKVQMNDLSKTLTKLFRIASKLPPGEDRQAALREVRQFQARLRALRSSLELDDLEKTA